MSKGTNSFSTCFFLSTVQVTATCTLRTVPSSGICTTSIQSMKEILNQNEQIWKTCFSKYPCYRTISKPQLEHYLRCEPWKRYEYELFSTLECRWKCLEFIFLCTFQVEVLKSFAQCDVWNFSKGSQTTWKTDLGLTRFQLWSIAPRKRSNSGQL